jgi:hypothetical protein
MSGCLAVPFHSWLMAEGGSPHTPNGEGDIWVEALANCEHGVMPKSIDELKVCPFVFGHNSHSQIHEASRDQR